MRAKLVEQFRVQRNQAWTVGVEDSERNTQSFKIEQDWRYTLEAPKERRRPTVNVVLKKGPQERPIAVPEGTTEEGMKQLLVSGFAADVRTRWRVLARSRMGRIDPYELKEHWSYEMVEYAPPAVQESYRVMANRCYDGVREDMEIETGWREGQVHERCRETWAGELRRKHDPRKGEDGIPNPRLITRNEAMQEMPFEAREGWTYELKDQEATPQWVYTKEFSDPPRPLHPGELVLVGLQLEDGPRLERKVKRDLSEHGLMLMMWQALGYPRGPLHLHITNERSETMYEFRISPQYTYVLRRRPRDTLRNKQERRSVDDEERNMKSATRTMREARIVETSGGAGASKTAAQGKGGQKGKSSTEARTGPHGRAGHHA
jgi:hypothetical protein